MSRSTDDIRRGASAELAQGIRGDHDFGDLSVEFQINQGAAELPTLVFVECHAVETPAPWRRNSFLETQPFTRIFINDPTVRAHPDTAQGWGVGSASTSGISAILDLVHKLDGVASEKRIYIGSGGDGYTALYLAIVDEAGAVAVSNPDLGWHHAPGPAAMTLLDRFPIDILRERRLDILTIPVGSRRPIIDAAANSANPQFAERIIPPLITLVSSTESPADPRRSRVAIYRDEQRPTAPLAPSEFETRVLELTRVLSEQ